MAAFGPGWSCLSVLAGSGVAIWTSAGRFWAAMPGLFHIWRVPSLALSVRVRLNRVVPGMSYAVAALPEGWLRSVSVFGSQKKKGPAITCPWVVALGLVWVCRGVQPLVLHHRGTAGFPTGAAPVCWEMLSVGPSPQVGRWPIKGARVLVNSVCNHDHAIHRLRLRVHHCRRHTACLKCLGQG